MFTLVACFIAFVIGIFVEDEFSLTRHFEAWLHKVLDR